MFSLWLWDQSEPISSLVVFPLAFWQHPFTASGVSVFQIYWRGRKSEGFGHHGWSLIINSRENLWVSTWIIAICVINWNTGLTVLTSENDGKYLFILVQLVNNRQLLSIYHDHNSLTRWSSSRQENMTPGLHCFDRRNGNQLTKLVRGRVEEPEANSYHRSSHQSSCSEVCQRVVQLSIAVTLII